MALYSHRRTDRHGELVLTIRATGAYDICRLAHNLQMAQAEFAAVGRKTESWLRRKLGAGGWKALTLRLWGSDSAPAPTALQVLRTAAADPGRFVKRESHDDPDGHGTLYEALYAWQARAALKALADAGLLAEEAAAC
jgi:hypothetical protein